MAATSRPDLIDPALLRPGRLDRLVLCELPSAEQRVDILTALARRLRLDADADLRQARAACTARCDCGFGCGLLLGHSCWSPPRLDGGSISTLPWAPSSP